MYFLLFFFFLALSKIVYFLQKGEFKIPVMEKKDTLDSTCDLKYIFLIFWSKLLL